MNNIDYNLYTSSERARLEDVRALTTLLMRKHELLPAWKFKWINAVHTLGRCYYRRKVIVLSRRYVLRLDDLELIDLILHEIAHALTPYHGHDHIWRTMCVEIGANPNRLYEGEVTHDKVAIPTYQMIDSTTGRVIKKYYRKPAASTYRKLATTYMKGRREETIGKLIITEVSLEDLL